MQENMQQYVWTHNGISIICLFLINQNKQQKAPNALYKNRDAENIQLLKYKEQEYY